MYLRNINIQVVSFPYRDIIHQSYHISKYICTKLHVLDIELKNTSPSVIYHVKNSTSP